MKNKMTSKRLVKIDELAESMTPKQAKFFGLWLSSGNGTKSAMEAYDCKDENIAASVASQNLRLLKNPVKTFLEKNGVSLGYLTTILVKATQAERRDQFSGEMNPDHKIRIEAVDRLSNWLEIEPLKENGPTTAIQINVNEDRSKYT